MTKETLLKIVYNIFITDELVYALNQTFEKYEINTKLRQCHFLAQILYESNRFSAIIENLNYSAEGLLKTFPKRFLTLTLAKEYAFNPEKIANFVYSNRMGNGDEASGDGWKYRGRGPIMITGKKNYFFLSQNQNIDYVANPELLEKQPHGMFSAGWYWDQKNLNSLADQDDIENITRRINGGLNGFENRKKWFDVCKNYIEEA